MQVYLRGQPNAVDVPDQPPAPKATITTIADHTVLIEKAPVVAAATFDDTGNLHFLGVALKVEPSLPPVLITNEHVAHWVEYDLQLAFSDWWAA